MIVWDKTDFIDFFETCPQENEDLDIYCEWNIKQEKLKLHLRIDVNLGDTFVSISHDDFEAPFTSMAIRECQMAKVVKESKKPHIEFAPGKFFGSRYDESYIIDYGFRLYKYPNWHIELFQK
ncbi:hypothetical protein IQ249_04685 [Lusitaniella coriacea LEGE 07157]|uniref:Uncharacterized protein n=1 Tax=Lusitaniella coriacea LEGE 07157 TaxID=945747 RepID=A0A8J7DU65_9CYAN|nr:hypothetical protein [Lusitaniella coriacea]MBE9115191.1 hypothetical protein [Lusitaniella coriacea LEGE 07157]